MEKSVLIEQAMELDRKVHRYLRRQSFEAWMNLDLTVPQVKTLFFVSNEGQTNSRALARAMHVTPSNITGIVDRLVEQGLLSRQGKPDDRRVLVLRTTDKGENLIGDLRERRISNLRMILSDLSIEELSRLVEGLSALAQSAHENQEVDKDEYDRSLGPNEEVRALHSGR